jgi:hypothetical protein
MKRFNGVIPFIIFSLLVFSCVFQVFGRSGIGPGLGGDLKKILPGSFGELYVKDIPLGETELMNAEVRKTLAYDDYVYRNYVFRNSSVNVLVFYWNPGKIQPRLVSSHTPDGCWVRSGMKIVEADTNEQLRFKNISFINSQGRVFETGAGLYYVSYWHLVDGLPFGYGLSYQPPWYAIVTDLLKHGLNMRSSQVYVRIHSTTKISEIFSDEAFLPVMRSLGDIGLLGKPNQSFKLP